MTHIMKKRVLEKLSFSILKIIEMKNEDLVFIM